MAAHLLERCLTPQDSLHVAGSEYLLCAGSIEQARLVYRFIRALHAVSLINDAFGSIAKGLRNYYDLYGYDIAEYSTMLDSLVKSLCRSN